MATSMEINVKGILKENILSNLRENGKNMIGGISNHWILYVATVANSHLS